MFLYCGSMLQTLHTRKTPAFLLRATPGVSPPSVSLSPDDRRKLEVESSISPEYIARRGYYTATKLADVPEVLKGRQRRLGLVIPTYSPSGARGFRLRPKKPISPARKYEQPAGVCSILDVYPFNLERVRDPRVELWITEGEKTADSLASRGGCVISVPGVHNFAEKGSAGTEGLLCWEYVPLQGRTVTIVYDSDARTKAGVQLALQRLVALLEGKGADVYVVYLPEVDDA
jgi:putative DNA primase/helicase